MAIKKKKKAMKKKKSVKKIIKRKLAKKPKALKKVLKKKPVKKIKKRLSSPKGSREEMVGVITHYFPHVKAAVFKVKTSLSLGEKIRIKGHTTDFVQTVRSMQIERSPITAAKKGDEIGLEVDSRVRRKDKVTKAKS